MSTTENTQPEDSPAVKLSPEHVARIIKQMKRNKLLAERKINKIAKRRMKNKMARKSRRKNKILKNGR